MYDLDTTTAEQRHYATVMYIFVAIMFFSVFPLFLGFALLSAAAVAVFRGRYFVRWRAPEECLSTASWAADEWDYKGLGGRQTGLRALGLEVAFNGLLR